jgi:hypothetical protein
MEKICSVTELVLRCMDGPKLKAFIMAILVSESLAECLGHHTENEGPVRIQYRCLVPIYVFPEMKLYSLVISKTEL